MTRVARRLRSDIAWRVDADRLYLHQGRPWREIGVPLVDLPPDLLSLAMGQLRVGVLPEDLLFLLGRRHRRSADLVLQALSREQLIEDVPIQWSIDPRQKLERLDLSLSSLPRELALPGQCRLLVQCGRASHYVLPASIASLLRPEAVIHDVHLASGHLVLARGRSASPCIACLLLWFFGSSLLPLSFLSACLNDDPMDDSARDDRVRSACDAIAQGGAAILYFAGAQRAPTVLDVPLGPHPACGCRAANHARQAVGSSRAV